MLLGLLGALWMLTTQYTSHHQQQSPRDFPCHSAAKLSPSGPSERDGQHEVGCLHCSCPDCGNNSPYTDYQNERVGSGVSVEDADTALVGFRGLHGSLSVDDPRFDPEDLSLSSQSQSSQQSILSDVSAEEGEESIDCTRSISADVETDGGSATKADDTADGDQDPLYDQCLQVRDIAGDCKKYGQNTDSVLWLLNLVTTENKPLAVEEPLSSDASLSLSEKKSQPEEQSEHYDGMLTASLQQLCHAALNSILAGETTLSSEEVHELLLLWIKQVRETSKLECIEAVQLTAGDNNVLWSIIDYLHHYFIPHDRLSPYRSTALAVLDVCVLNDLLSGVSDLVERSLTMKYYTAEGEGRPSSKKPYPDSVNWNRQEIQSTTYRAATSRGDGQEPCVGFVQNLVTLTRALHQLQDLFFHFVDPLATLEDPHHIDVNTFLQTLGRCYILTAPEVGTEKSAVL